MASDDFPLPQRTIGLLLAGGESRRMGTAKALLDFRGRPLWQRMRDLLLAAGCERVLISGDFPRDIPEAIPDATPGIGPLGGIATIANTLHAADNATLLVVPVDLPLLDVATLRDLLQHDPQAAAAHYATHALPARFRFDAAFRTALAACVADPDPRRRSLQALAARLHAEELPLGDLSVISLTNVNTPEEWRRVISSQHHD